MKAITTAMAMLMVSLFTILTAAAQNEKEFTGSLLWKISGKGLSQPSYILGTHHLKSVNFVDSIPGLKQAMEDTEQTVGELVMSDMANAQIKMQQAAMMPAGVTYNDLLSAEDYTKLDNRLREIIGGGLDQFSIVKPGMISMIYTVTSFSKLYPEFNPMSHEAIDAYVQRIATENGKDVTGLENIEDQIYALFDAEPLKAQAEVLVCTIEHNDQLKTQLDAFNSSYSTGDLVKMYDLSFNNPTDPCEVSQTQKNALAKNRNNKWLEKLPNIMSEKSALIAVGALHLAGEEGLLPQLAKMGYNVEAVK